MKKLLTILFFFVLSVSSKAQISGNPFPNLDSMRHYNGSLNQCTVSDPDSGGVFTQIISSATIDNVQYFASSRSGWRWLKLGGTEDNVTFPSAIYTIPTLGQNFSGYHSAAAWIRAAFYAAQPPTASLTGGIQIELSSASTTSETLNWTAGRQTNTATLASIVVAGVSQSFSQPAPNSSVSGTQSVNVPSNTVTNTTYSNIVTATDATSATATTQFSCLGKKYYGLINDTTGIGTGAQDANIRALTNAFATSRALTTGTGTPSGNQFWVYIYPTSLGNLTSVTFNGIPSLSALTTFTKSFTNASGGVQSYTYYYTTNIQSVASSVIAQ